MQDDRRRIHGERRLAQHDASTIHVRRCTRSSEWHKKQGVVACRGGSGDVRPDLHVLDQQTGTLQNPRRRAEWRVREPDAFALQAYYGGREAAWFGRAMNRALGARWSSRRATTTCDRRDCRRGIIRTSHVLAVR